MAPREPAATAKPAKKSATTESNKVVKRPARGYHRYKNGLLNVTPKGKEIEVVRNNQNSPLLRLPPEIRNRIWEYTLGHTTFGIIVHWNPHKKPTLKRPSNEPIINTALLRSCRQIYLEAALIPMRLNTFAFHDGTWMIKRAMKLLRTHQWRNIKNIKFDIEDPDMCIYAGFESPGATKESLTGLFPAAKRIEVVLYPATYPESTPMAEAEANIRYDYSLLLQDRSISLTVTSMDEPMPAWS